MLRYGAWFTSLMRLSLHFILQRLKVADVSPARDHDAPGIDDTIKLWAPTAPERSPVPPEAHRVMERNREARARGPERAVLPVSPEILRLLFGRRRGAGSDDERGHEGGEDSDGEEGCRVS